MSAPRRLLPLVLVALLGCAEPVNVAPPEPSTLGDAPAGAGGVARTEPGPDGLVIALRQILARSAPKDGVWIALHFEADGDAIPAPEAADPVDALERAARERYAVRDLVRSLRFEITRSDGATAELRVEADGAFPSNAETPCSLWHAPTLLLRCSPTRLGVGWTAGSGNADAPNTADAAWRNGTDTSLLGEPGRLALRVAGQFDFTSGAKRPFRSEPVEIELTESSATFLRLESLLRAATAAAAAEWGIADGATVNVLSPAFSPDLPRFVFEDLEERVVFTWHHGSPPWYDWLWTASVARDGTDIRLVESGHLARMLGTSCVARGVMVDTPDGRRPIEELSAGDTVTARDPESGEISVVRVHATRSAAASATLWLTDGLRVTAEHPVFADGAWTPAGEIASGAALVARDGSTVAAAPRADGQVEVFDLTVAPPHTFFAGGVLVHNKQRAYDARWDDPWYHCWERAHEE